jgi:EAL domain-containing protein (putative c-di-GMP-specific phosphodiesterase class I)
VQRRDREDAEALVHRADLAMYEAKRRRDGQAVGYDAVIERSDHEAHAIERALRSTLDGANGALSVVYQPIVEARTGEFVQAEALARWTSAELGAVPPGRFIAVAEQAGLIGEVGAHVFALVCDDLQAHPDLRVSLNVSPVQLMAPTYVAGLVQALATRGIAPARVELELTEGLVVDDPELASRRIAELRAAGFTVSLDDFGTGYSSIGYLREFGFDTLKIDRAFVTGLAASAELRKLCGGMIQIGQALGLIIVCEGIETAEELALVAGLDCDLAQGFHIGRPMTVGELKSRWLAPPHWAVAGEAGRWTTSRDATLRDRSSSGPCGGAASTG